MPTFPTAQAPGPSFLQIEQAVQAARLHQQQHQHTRARAASARPGARTAARELEWELPADLAEAGLPTDYETALLQLGEDVADVLAARVAMGSPYPEDVARGGAVLGHAGGSPADGFRLGSAGARTNDDIVARLHELVRAEVDGAYETDAALAAAGGL